MTRQIRRMDDLLAVGSTAAFKIRDIDGTALDGVGIVEEVLQEVIKSGSKTKHRPAENAPGADGPTPVCQQAHVDAQQDRHR